MIHPPKTDRFRIVTYNIHRGLSAFRKKGVLDRIAEALDASQADMICLQELWEWHGQRESQLSLLARDVWPHSAYGRNAVFEGGHQGNAILSRFPIRSVRNIDLSVPGAEPRGCLVAEIAIPAGGVLTVMNQHWGLTEPERTAQHKRLNAIVEQHHDPKAPLIMTGDFNDWRGRFKTAAFKRFGLVDAHRIFAGCPARTYPSLFPLFPLDRIYVANLEVFGSRTLRAARFRGLSDHLPLEADLGLAPSST